MAVYQITPSTKYYVDDRIAQQLWKKRKLVRKKDRDYFAIVDGEEGCIPAGSKVLMSDDKWKNVEDVKLGDSVLSPLEDGTHISSKVLKTFQWMCNEMYDVVDADTKKILYSCSYNHLIPIAFINPEEGKPKSINIEAKKLGHTFKGEKSFFTFKSSENKDISRVRIDVVPSKKKEIVYGFTLDSPSSWYVTDDYVITHNSGKSVLSFQLAKFVDPTFNLNRVAFTGMQFLRAIQIAKKGQAVVFDEAFTGLSARSSMSEINRLLIETVMEVRKKNLFVFIVLPSVFYLDRYIVLARARVLFHTYLKNERRGGYCVYDKVGLKFLALNGKKNMTYGVTRPKMYAKFTGTFALDKNGEHLKQERYNEMKSEAIQNKGKNKLKEKQVRQRNYIFARLISLGYPQINLLKELQELGEDMTQQRLSSIVEEGNKMLMGIQLQPLKPLQLA